MHFVVKDKLSTNEHSAKNGEINIYPNPASDKLYINNVRDITTYKIIDASGKIIQSGDFTQNPIDIHSLKGGVLSSIIFLIRMEIPLTRDSLKIDNINKNEFRILNSFCSYFW